MNFTHIKILIAVFIALLVAALYHEFYIKRRRRKLKWIKVTLAQMQTVTDSTLIHERGEEIVTLIHYYGILPSHLGWDSFEEIPVFGLWFLGELRQREQRNLVYWEDLAQRFPSSEYGGIPLQITHARSRLSEIDLKLLS